MKKTIDTNLFVEVCKSSKTMAEAATVLGLHFNTFKKYALLLGCYQPNQAGISIRKNIPKVAIEEIILNGNYPHYQTFKLKKRLLLEGFKINKCEICSIISWNNQSIEMELHHIDGNRINHHISNLMLLCPNCHSQTDSFRAKNKKIECLQRNL